MQIGVDSFAAAISDPATGLSLSPVDRMQHLLEEIELADKFSLDVFGIGEHHREEFLDSAPIVILAAAAARTKSIRLTSAVTVLSAADPVRVFQEFATLDLISHGRAEIVAGRGSFVEAPFSVSVWKTTTRSSKRSSTSSSPSARTRTSTGLASTARLSPARRSTLVRCRTRCPYGSASGEPLLHSSAQVCSDSL
jgi:Luciferase-like monooxygenase